LGWEKVTKGEIVVHEVPGEHMALLRSPHVEGLAAAILQRLQEIDS